LCDAMVGSLSVATIAVSSAKVAEAVYLLHKLMCLFYCGVPLSEAKLITGLSLTSGRIVFKCKFSTTLEVMGKRLIGWLVG
jgi:hypothetical protein